MAKRAPTFRELAQIALHDLEALGNDAEVVCGPISTGGVGNPVFNLLIFSHAIEVLTDAGRPIFNQLPYEAGLADLHVVWMRDNPSAEYCEPILTEFYLPLLESNRIRRAWFLPGWETSKGATWEHGECRARGIDIRYLDDRWMYELNVPTL